MPLVLCSYLFYAAIGCIGGHGGTFRGVGGSPEGVMEICLFAFFSYNFSPACYGSAEGPPFGGCLKGSGGQLS